MFIRRLTLKKENLPGMKPVWSWWIILAIHLLSLFASIFVNTLRSQPRRAIGRYEAVSSLSFFNIKEVLAKYRDRESAWWGRLCPNMLYKTLCQIHLPLGKERIAQAISSIFVIFAFKSVVLWDLIWVNAEYEESQKSARYLQWTWRCRALHKTYGNIH